MSEIIQKLPDIIVEASKSSLGIVALMVIVMSALSWGFFRNSSEPWKLATLVLLFIGCISFGYSINKEIEKIPKNLITINTGETKSIEGGKISISVLENGHAPSKTGCYFHVFSKIKTGKLAKYDISDKGYDLTEFGSVGSKLNVVKIIAGKSCDFNVSKS